MKLSNDKHRSRRLRRLKRWKKRLACVLFFSSSPEPVTFYLSSYGMLNPWSNDKMLGGA